MSDRTYTVTERTAVVGIHNTRVLLRGIKGHWSFELQWGPVSVETGPVYGSSETARAVAEGLVLELERKR